MPTAALSPPTASASARLRAETAALRLSFTWFGIRKSLSSAQKTRAAPSFGAEAPFLSAGKKLLDTGHPRLRAVAAVRRQATADFQGMSLPFPEAAVRLVRQTDLDDIQARLTEFQEELSAEVAQLDESFDELRRSARDKLGRLYCEGDYPASLTGEFGMSWDFPSVEPPEYLRRLSPALYQEECRRATARFDEAIQLAEQMLLGELDQLVTHLAERLSGQADGKPKVFRDSAVENLTEFFARFQRLNIRSSSELDELVGRAGELLIGVHPGQLRDSSTLRRQVSAELGRLEASLDGLLTVRPRRHLLRGAR